MRFIRKWGETGTEDGQFDNPRGIAYYNDEIFIVDATNYRIQVFNKDGEFKRRWPIPSDLYGIHTAITVLNDEVYVASSNIDIFGAIFVFNLAGDLQRTLIPTIQDFPVLHYPLGLTNDGENIYVGDLFDPTVYILTPQGVIQFQIPPAEAEENPFLALWDVLIHQDELYVSDNDAGAVLVFDLEGNLQRTLTINYPTPEDTALPNGLASYGSNILVTDPSNGCIHKITKTGDLLETFGSPGTGDENFDHPNYITANTLAYITDSSLDRVTVWGEPAKIQYLPIVGIG